MRAICPSALVIFGRSFYMIIIIRYFMIAMILVYD
jgi:hypothetical protein